MTESASSPKTDALDLACSNLLTLARNDSWMATLFRDHVAGAWSPVDPQFPTLAVTWLADPGGDPDFAVVLFFDSASVWSMTAIYNAARLRS